MPPPHRPSHRPTPLPPYEPPTHPLTPTAQRALQALPQTHPLTRLKRHLDIATTSLTDLAGEVNDRYWQRAEYMRRRRVRRAGQGHEGAEEERETETERMRGEVEGMTVRMEVSVRGVIDARVHVEGTERALGEVVGNVVAGNGTVAGTQSTLGASQFRGWRGGRRRRRMRGRAGDEGEEEEEGSEFEEEEGAATQDQDGQENVGPVELLRKKMEEHKVRYEGLPLRARYVSSTPCSFQYACTRHRHFGAEKLTIRILAQLRDQQLLHRLQAHRARRPPPRRRRAAPAQRLDLVPRRGVSPSIQQHPDPSPRR